MHFRWDVVNFTLLSKGSLSYGRYLKPKGENREQLAFKDVQNQSKGKETKSAEGL